MRHVPWVTLILTAIFFVTPLGTSIIDSALFSGEKLANSISQFMLMVVVAIVLVAAAIEWCVKVYVRRRRRNAAATS